jgi:hypothetical protein
MRGSSFGGGISPAGSAAGDFAVMLKNERQTIRGMVFM